MKKVIFIAIVVLLFISSCNEYKVAQSTFTPIELAPIIPQGMVFGESIGKNWWSGTYLGEKIVIHAIPTSYYVNVEFQYVKE